jgi:hypothetical protein
MHSDQIYGDIWLHPNPSPSGIESTAKLTQELMPDSPAKYESWPHRSLVNLLQSHPAYDWLVSMYQNTRLSARKIDRSSVSITST